MLVSAGCTERYHLKVGRRAAFEMGDDLLDLLLFVWSSELGISEALNCLLQFLVRGEQFVGKESLAT